MKLKSKTHVIGYCQNCGCPIIGHKGVSIDAYKMGGTRYINHDIYFCTKDCFHDYNQVWKVHPPQVNVTVINIKLNDLRFKSSDPMVELYRSVRLYHEK